MRNKSIKKILVLFLISLSILNPARAVFAKGNIENRSDVEDGKVKKHIYSTGGKVATIDDGRIAYHHTDHLTGSNVDTNEDGNVFEVIDYYPFGSVRVDDSYGGYENDYKYTGKELDDDTGLYYYEARYYNSEIGRFISVDPASRDNPIQFLTDPQQLNMYSYAKNNPVAYVDNSGRSSLYFLFKVANYIISHSPNIPNKIREINFTLDHPIVAYQIGSATDGSTKNLSSISSNFAVNLTINDLGYTGNQSKKGTERNALRHVVWQGILTNEFGSDIAEQAGNSHEYNPFADLSITSFSDEALADQSVDLLNNQIGRDIATQNPELTSQEITQKSLDYFYNNGLYIVQQDSQGMYNVTQTKITEKQYKNSSEKLSNLNNNGLSE